MQRVVAKNIKNKKQGPFEEPKWVYKDSEDQGIDWRK
jgi:hypothetical protein